MTLSALGKAIHPNSYRKHNPTTQTPTQQQIRSLAASSTLQSTATHRVPQIQGLNSNHLQSPLGKRTHEEDAPPLNTQCHSPNKKQTCESSKAKLNLYACLFHQRKPDVYRVTAHTGNRYMRCAAAGWSMHRLKQHVERNHMAPLQCDRCCAIFASNEERRQHSRMDPPCVTRNPPIIVEGATKEQLTALGRTPLHEKSEDTWKRWYGVLFNGETAPSPYYTPSRSQDKRIELAALTMLQNFEISLPELVLKTLQRRLQEDHLSPIDERISTYLPAAIRSAISDLSKNYSLSEPIVQFDKRITPQVPDTDHNSTPDLPNEAETDVCSSTHLEVANDATGLHSFSNTIADSHHGHDSVGWSSIDESDILHDILSSHSSLEQMNGTDLTSSTASDTYNTESESSEIAIDLFPDDYFNVESFSSGNDLPNWVTHSNLFLNNTDYASESSFEADFNSLP